MFLFGVVRDFYERERVRVERIKYWFVIGFVGGVVFGKNFSFKFLFFLGCVIFLF